MAPLRSTVIAALALAACGGEPQAPPIVPPAGAVVQVGPDEYLAEPGWIYAEEVDRWIDAVAMVQPTETQLSWRRKSLTNIVLPMRGLALVFPNEREETQRVVQELHTAALAGELSDERVERQSGHVLEVGLDRWGTARTLNPGEWSEVYETLGGFTFLRVVEAPPAAEWETITKIVIEHVTVYFLEPEEMYATVDDVLNKLKFHAVDPDWDWILPKYYEYKRAVPSD